MNTLSHRQFESKGKTPCTPLLARQSLVAFTRKVSALLFGCTAVPRPGELARCFAKSRPIVITESCAALQFPCLDPGVRVVRLDLKICELCTATFPRESESDTRLCETCGSRKYWGVPEFLSLFAEGCRR